MKSFLLALALLTRIPVPDQGNATGAQLGTSVLFYPLVGLTIGSLLILAGTILQPIPVNVQAAVILSFWVLLTGGLHLDGLADCTDAWVGGLGDKQRSLSIMKDPAAGPMAVVILILVLIVKWTAIFECLKINSFLLLLLTPMLGRLSILALMVTAPYIRKGGMGEKQVQQLPMNPAWFILISGIAVAGLFIGLISVLAGIAVFLLVRWIAVKRLDGVTGDIYGACVELVEVAVLTVGIV